MSEPSRLSSPRPSASSPLPARAASAVLRRASRLRARLRGRTGRSRRIRRYLRSADAPRLHLGCGENVLPGWLNADLLPQGPGVIAIDVRRPLPLPDGCMRRVFAEHLIEHLDFEDGRKLLHECHRVLEPGGRIRVATPELRRIASLLDADLGNDGDIRTRYLRWLIDWCFPGREDCEPALAVNHFLRAWGHRFCYTREALEAALKRAGFERIRVCQCGESEDALLDGIDGHAAAVGRPELMAFETLTLEAERPASSP
jgi:SAM-dependent methyltransferase